MINYSKISESELTGLLKTGDHDAFTEIYKRYWMVMYAHALKMLKSEEDARDVVQETFTSLWKKNQSLCSDNNLGGYLFVSTKNKVLDIIAQQRVRMNYAESLIAFAKEYHHHALDPIEEKEIIHALKKEDRTVASQNEEDIRNAGQ